MAWRFQLEVILKVNDIYNVIKDEKLKKAAASDAEKYEKWTKK